MKAFSPLKMLDDFFKLSSTVGSKHHEYVNNQVINININISYVLAAKFNVI